MRNLEKKLRAAIVQAAPVFFDKQATLQKVVHQIDSGKTMSCAPFRPASSI